MNSPFIFFSSCFVIFSFPPGPGTWEWGDFGPGWHWEYPPPSHVEQRDGRIHHWERREGDNRTVTTRKIHTSCLDRCSFSRHVWKDSVSWYAFCASHIPDFRHILHSQTRSHSMCSFNPARFAKPWQAILYFFPFCIKPKTMLATHWYLVFLRKDFSANWNA